jgi:hypothetical protein
MGLGVRVTPGALPMTRNNFGRPLNVYSELPNDPTRQGKQKLSCHLGNRVHACEWSNSLKHTVKLIEVDWLY